MARKAQVTGAEGGEGKRHALNMRTTRETREALDRAALMSGRSLVQEVEHRLEQSFAEDRVLTQIFGGEQSAVCAMTIGRTIKEVQKGSDVPFQDDDDTFAAAVIGMATVVRYYADLRSNVDDDKYPEAYERGTAAARAAIRALNPALRKEFLDEAEIGQADVDNILYNPTKARGALRGRRRPFKVKAEA